MSLPAILADNIACVRRAIVLVEQLDSDFYTGRHPDFFNGTIGCHVRHNIDHYLSFFRGMPTGRIDYDNRDRDPRLETDPGHASCALEGIARQLSSLECCDLDAPCSVRVNADSDDASDPNQWSSSTLRRELQFLQGHAIHHDAQVAAMCRISGVEPPENFGMAPSTSRYRARCAAGV